MRFQKCSLRGLGILLVTSSALAGGLWWWLFPVPVPPQLPGPHQVGTFTLEFPAENHRGRLVAQLWYPADAVDGLAPVPWLPDAKLAPGFPYQRLAESKSNARRDATPTAGSESLPVVFYEHSWMGHRAENIAQLENLASRGFVVVAVDHPGQAARVLFSDSSVALGKLAALPDIETAQGVAKFEAEATTLMEDRCADLERVRVALMGDAGKLTGRAKLDRVGIFGFSFGGTTALRICSTNPAFVAAANEDGLMLENAAPNVPLLFFDSELPAWLAAPAKPEETAGQALVRRSEERIRDAVSQPGRHRCILKGTRHLSFTDHIFSSAHPRLAKVGSRPASEVHKTVTRELADFFETHL
jgi:predicted dienelactone hydrolase